MVVDGGTDDAPPRFVRAARLEWPRLETALPVDEDGLEAAAEAQRERIVREIIAAGVEGQRRPLRIVSIRSKTRGAIVVAALHHFMVRRRDPRVIYGDGAPSPSPRGRK